MKIKNILIEHRENLQLIYGVFLMILIPSLIAYNTLVIISKYNESIDASLQRKALTVGRTIYASLQDELDSKENLQKSIEEIYQKSGEFEKIEILTPEENSFKVIASSDTNRIEKKIDFYYYNVAWIQPDNDGLATDSLKLSTTKQGEEFVNEENEDERFWLVAMPMQDKDGNKKAILSMKLSSKIIDDLTNSNRNASMYIMLFTVLISVLFLSVTIRLWDYVVLYRKIKEVDQMKDEFISIASHELRTPLTSIKGYTSMIMEGTFGKIENPKMNESLGKIANSTTRLENLVEDLLNVSRLEQGRLLMEIRDIQIEPIIEEIVSQLSITAEQKKLALIFEKPSEKIPLISADSERIKQVLVNLIGNGIKYTETGNVTVSMEIKKDKLKIKVSDTGLGISPEAQKSLFQKFYRVKTDKTEGIQGTGLGLWITKQIVELMNGKIYLESIEGKGSQFTVELNMSKKSV